MIGRIEYPCTSAVGVGVGVRVCGYSQLMVQVNSRRAESMDVESVVIVVGAATTGTATRTQHTCPCLKWANKYTLEPDAVIRVRIFPRAQIDVNDICE